MTKTYYSQFTAAVLGFCSRCLYTYVYCDYITFLVFSVVVCLTNTVILLVCPTSSNKTIFFQTIQYTSKIILPNYQTEVFRIVPSLLTITVKPYSFLTHHTLNLLSCLCCNRNALTHFRGSL